MVEFTLRVCMMSLVEEWRSSHCEFQLYHWWWNVRVHIESLHVVIGGVHIESFHDIIGGGMAEFTLRVSMMSLVEFALRVYMISLVVELQSSH